MNEEKKIFDPKFVHFMWDDSLGGKEGFYSDSISCLVKCVESNALAHRDCIVADKINHDIDNLFPFMDSRGASYRFFYYDPLYEIKWAWKKGKQIQARSKGSTRNEWMNMERPGWSDNYEYRVKPEKEWRPFKDIVELKHAWNFKRGPMVHSDIDEPEIWVRDKKRPDITRLITGFNGGCNCVALAGEWHILEGLFDDYEFLDGTPCGVEE